MVLVTSTTHCSVLYQLVQPTYAKSQNILLHYAMVHHNSDGTRLGLLLLSLLCLPGLLLPRLPLLASCSYGAQAAANMQGCAVDTMTWILWGGLA
jgi:hypothetical protein